MPAHTLPSARGQGEPLSSKLNPADGAAFVTLVAGQPEEWVLLSHDAGYGFITPIASLYVKNKNGKACLKLPTQSQVLAPRLIRDVEQQLVACVTNTGRLLVFAVQELPQLARGKGNKMINISSLKASQREEFVVDLCILSPDSSLTIFAGKRHFTLKPDDLAAYRSERGRRGNRLPRGLQNVSRLASEPVVE